MRDHSINARAVARDGPVDPLWRKKQCAADVAGFAQVQKRALDRSDVVKAGEVIKCSYSIHTCRIRPLAEAFKSDLQRWPARQRQR